MPIRLTLFLFFVLFVIIFILGNSNKVDLRFIFWVSSFKLYKIILFSTLSGMLLAWFLMKGVHLLKTKR